MTEPTEEPKVEMTPGEPVKAIVEPAPIEQEEPFDKERAMATITKLRESEKALKAKAKLADELQAEKAKREEAELSETDRLAKQLAETQAQLKTMELTNLRRTVADKVGLPAAFVDRLKGETAEEIEADAKALLEALPKAPKTGSLTPTSPGEKAAPHGETEQEQRDRIYGNNRGLFDPATMKSLGGGVVFKDGGQ